MTHKETIWQLEDDASAILKRKGLNYPDEDPTVRIQLSENDLVTGEDSFFPADFYQLAQSLNPPFYGLADLSYIYDEDCLPTNLQVPLFNLKALEVLRTAATDTFKEYPVFVLDVPLGLQLLSAKDFLTDPRVKVAPDGYALIKPLAVLDKSFGQLTKTNDGLSLESDQVIPALFQSGDVLYVQDKIKRRLEKAGLRGIAFSASIGFSDFV